MSTRKEKLVAKRAALVARVEQLRRDDIRVIEKIKQTEVNIQTIDEMLRADQLSGGATEQASASTAD